ncbi:UPF0102 protein [Pseudoxanthomonas indica]|nr:UPF0102 protein [Pseudoxanthomonas indica]
MLDAGLRQIARNVAMRLGELDLVMHDGQSLVFVEVRYRGNAGFGGGAESVDWSKQRRIVRAAELFLLRNRQWNESPCRFDIVEADGDPDAPRLNWIRDAFRADD